MISLPSLPVLPATSCSMGGQYLSALLRSCLSKGQYALGGVRLKKARAGAGAFLRKVLLDI